MAFLMTHILQPYSKSTRSSQLQAQGDQRLNENGQMMNPENHEIEEEAARIAQTGPVEPIEEQDASLEPNQEE
jgi:hypothetical protein